MGEVKFERDLRPFMPLIKAGEVVHVGKDTTFGMGKYIINPKEAETSGHIQ